jgi:putative beta barrel porin BBP7
MLRLRPIQWRRPAPELRGLWKVCRLLVIGIAIVAILSPAAFALVDDLDPDQFQGGPVIVDGYAGFVPVFDYQDLHTFNIFLEYMAVGGVPLSGAVDALDVIWLNDETASEQADDTIVSWQTAEPLRVGDWQVTGIDGGSVSPSDVRWLGEIGPAPQMAAAPQGSRRNDFGIIYGLRMIERQNSIYVTATGGIIGASYWHTEAENHVIGPQLGFVLLRNRGPWSIRLQATATAGFNYGDVQQNGSIGQRLIPGALNQSLFGRPTTFRHVDAHDEVSPSGELRFEASYRLTQNVSFAVTWSGIAIHNALLVEDRIRDFQPDAGLADPGNQQIFVHNLFCGVNVVL